MHPLTTGPLLCPHCGLRGSKVLDSRDKDAVRNRMRRCHKCGLRFATVEYLVPGNDGYCGCPACGVR